MTPLNTIIEEEKKKAHVFLQDSPCTLDDIGFAVREEDLDTLITTAMQRACEAGRSEERAKIREEVKSMKEDYHIEGQDALDTVLAKLTEKI